MTPQHESDVRERRDRLAVLRSLRLDLGRLSAVPADSPAAAGLLLHALARVRTLIDYDQARLDHLDRPPVPAP
jgi:hypothetical protein